MGKIFSAGGVIAMPTDTVQSLFRKAGVYTDHCQSVPIAHQIQRIYERDLTSHVFPGDTDAGQSFVHLDDAVVPPGDQKERDEDGRRRQPATVRRRRRVRLRCSTGLG